MLSEFVHEFLVSLMWLERRTEPSWRPYTDTAFREACAPRSSSLSTWGGATKGFRWPKSASCLMRRRRSTRSSATWGHMCRKYRPGAYERVGNTKTHGLVRAEVTIRDDLPPDYRQGIFRQARTFPAWVRFSGPRPDSPADVGTTSAFRA